MILFNKIKQFLDENSVEYKTIHHQTTLTSEESAKARGESIKIGAKALLMKGKKFVVVVLSADKKLNSKKLKNILGSKNLRFSTEEELTELTGCTKGCLPPFGHFFNLPLIVDSALFDEDKMAFNAGSLTYSIIMKTADYKDLLNPQIEDLVQ